MFVDPQLDPAPEAGAPVPAQAPALRVGMIGTGTVGSGVWHLLRRNRALIAARAGRPIDIVAVAARNPARAAERLAGAAGARLLADPIALAADPDIDVLLELAGGTEAPRTWAETALAHGKHVVTANKALLAEHGEALAALAVRQGRVLAYEAAVAGGLPVVKALREGLAGNHVEALAGILNGTSNYILTRMQRDGLGFAAALTEAQALGYAEADPTFDVDGVDAAHKLAVLAANAFGLAVPFAQVYVEGIRNLQACDVAAAAQWGYTVKLLALARRVPAERAEAVELRVHPALLPSGHPLARVQGVSNGLVVQGDACGPVFFSGAGAGAEPTASAVVADLVDVAKLAPGAVPSAPALGHRLVDPPAVLPIAQVQTRHFLRVEAGNALSEAQVVHELAQAGLAVERCAWMQAGAPVLTVLTAAAPDASATQAVERLRQRMDARVRRLRVEDLQD